MLVKIEARILIFPGTDFHFPSTSVPPGTFFRPCYGREGITHWYTSGARFTKYLTTILRILRLSYDNAKVTIDLRRTSNLQNIVRRAQGLALFKSLS